MRVRTCQVLAARWLMCAIAALCFSFAVLADDWPQFRGPNRDGISLEKGWFKTWPPQKVWEFDAGLGYSSVAVSNGRAYVTGHVIGEGDRGVDSVFCLDAATGNVLWTHKYKCMSSKKDENRAYFGPRATPVVDAGAVYTVSLEGHLFCLDAVSGKVRWYQDLNRYAIPDLPGLLYGYCSTPVIADGKVLCYVNGAIMAFDKTDGKPVWRCKGGRPLWNGSSPVVAQLGGKTCVIFGEEELVGADVATGDKIWSYPLGRVSVITPVVSGDRVFFSTYPNQGACGVFQVLDGQPKPLWTNREIKNYHVGNPVLWNGYLYGVDCSRTEYSFNDDKISSLKCLEFGTGKLKWTQKKIGWAQVLFVDGKLLIQREPGELIVAEASPDEYKEIGRAELPGGVYWAFPALSDGRIYCRSNEGKVVCLSTR